MGDEYKGSQRFEDFCAGLTCDGFELDYADDVEAPEDSGEEPSMTVIGYDLSVEFIPMAIRLTWKGADGNEGREFPDDGTIVDNVSMHVWSAIYFARGMLTAQLVEMEGEEEGE